MMREVYVVSPHTLSPHIDSTTVAHTLEFQCSDLGLFSSLPFHGKCCNKPRLTKVGKEG